MHPLLDAIVAKTISIMVCDEHARVTHFVIVVVVVVVFLWFPSSCLRSPVLLL